MLSKPGDTTNPDHCPLVKVTWTNTKVIPAYVCTGVTEVLSHVTDIDPVTEFTGAMK